MEPVLCSILRWTSVLILMDVATKVATLELFKGEMSFEFSFGFELPKRYEGLRRKSLCLLYLSAKSYRSIFGFRWLSGGRNFLIEYLSEDIILLEEVSTSILFFFAS